MIVNRTAIIYHIFCLCLLNWCRNRPGAVYPNPSSHILPIWRYVLTGTSVIISLRTNFNHRPSSVFVHITSLDPRSQSTSSVRDSAPTGCVHRDSLSKHRSRPRTNSGTSGERGSCDGVSVGRGGVGGRVFHREGS